MNQQDYTGYIHSTSEQVQSEVSELNLMDKYILGVDKLNLVIVVQLSKC